MQAYSDPERENDPHSLPDLEVFYLTSKEAAGFDALQRDSGEAEAGWYWWSCFPGCLPDSDPIGPFATQQEALEDARDN